MAIIRWNRPVPSMWPSAFDDDFFSNWPELSTVEKGLNIYETDEDVIVEASVPGVPEESVDVTIEGNVLTISASHEESDEEKDKKTVVYKSNRQRSFTYSTNLPRMVDSTSASAEVENGVVTITIPKTEEEKPKRIEVKRKGK